MLTNKVRAMLATLGKSQSFETRQPPSKISVVFIVAIAVRKFQKFESDKYKKSLTYNFDKQAAIDQLKNLYAADKAFFVKEFVKLAYFTRKFNLTFDDLNSLDVARNIIEHLKDGLISKSAADERMLHFLCLTLKYLTRNSKNETNFADVSLIAQLIGICDSDLIKNELVSLLMCSFEKLKNTDQNLELENLVLNLPEIDQDAKAFLISKVERNKVTEESKTKARPTMEVRKVKKNQQVVSKTIQTVKSKQETKKSEEADFSFLNLSDCMKARNRKVNTSTEPENLESKDGSDRSMFNTTWAEAINLFQLVSQGQVLKKDDKDNYLPEKLFGYHYFTTYGDRDAAKMYSFFINRMCVSIFCKISRKQQLNGKAIDKLLKCITDFENLVAVMGLTDDFVNFFTDRIIEKYWELKKITSPDIVSNFVKALIDETTEEYLVRGWLWNSTEVRQKSYDRDAVEKIIAAEINRVRLDAVKALYNCALRDKKTVLTKSRMEIIREYAKEPDEGSRADDTFLISISNLIELAETLNDFDYKEMFTIYLGHLKSDSTRNVNAHLRFMYNQARDLKRCPELFNDNVMKILIELMKPNSPFSTKLKLEVLEIIIACLEHETTQGLSDGNLKELLNHCFESNDNRQIDSGLFSLLLTTDKKRTLSQDVLKKLFKNFELERHNEDCTSYMVFILSRVFCADDIVCFLENPDLVESVSSKILCGHIIQLDCEDDERVKFSQPSEKTIFNSSNQISFLSAKMISRSVENKVILTSDTIDNMFLLLQSNNEQDKQAKIVTSKCLYSLTKYMSLESGDLNQLLDLINSQIYDVGVYAQAAYLRECVKVAHTSKLLDSIHLENISALYITDSLKLNQHDYEEEINKNLFKTLLYEARKQEFSDKNIFLLFDGILNMNGKYAPQVLNILVAYTYNYIIPETTIRTLENLLSVSSYFEKSLLILQNVILSRQATVTWKTLTIFIDYLCLSSNSRLRFSSFKLLEQVSQIQELPYDIFCKFELVRAGYALECQQGDKQLILRYIDDLTDKGMQLPVDTKLALGREISNKGVLKIFANVSRNKQIIEPNLLDDLIKLFDPQTAVNKDLIKIFENAAKNNQTLPVHLLEKLELALSKKDMEMSVLPVFIYLAQKGEILSAEVNNKLLDWLSIERDPVLRQELLSSLGSLINANKKAIKLYLPKLNRILATEIRSDNFNIQKLCIAAICKLVAVSQQIGDDLLEKLVEIGTDLNCSGFIRNEIEKLFESVENGYNPLISQKRYKEKIKLANLQCKSHENTLTELTVFANLGAEFLPQNYKQLKDMIDNRSLGLQEKTLNLLRSYKCKNKMTDDLLESIAILFDSSMSESVKSSCLQLFTEMVESGKSLNGRAGEIWETEFNRDVNVKKLLQCQVVRKIKQEIQLSDEVILNLLQLIRGTNKISDMETVADFIQLVIKEKLDYFENQSFVLLIEGLLIEKKDLEITLPCYGRIMKEKKACKVDECLQALVQNFWDDEGTSDLHQTQLFESMYYANKFISLPDVCLQFVVNNLDNRNETIRGYSFAILRTSTEKYPTYDKIFDYWCDIMLKNLTQNTGVEIEKSKDYLDLLEIIISVKFFDVTVFKSKQRDTWKRELLVSSIFESYKVYQMDQMFFYMSWFTVEEKFKYHKSCKILSLIQNSKFDSFSQIFELISMISELKFDDAIRMLTVNWPKPYEAFKQHWCVGKIQTCTSGISSAFCSKLAVELCSCFDIDFIAKLFSCLKSIDNLSTFENLIGFCAKEKIGSEDLTDLKNIQLNDLKLLIEAKHLCKRSKTQPKSQIEGQNFLQTYENLHKFGWNYAHLCELVSAFNPNAPFNKFQNLLHLLNTIQAYHLSSSSNFEKCKQIFTESKTFQEMIRELNKLAIENHFQLEGKVKDLNELMGELKDTNKTDQALVEFIKNGSLDVKKFIFEKEAEKLTWNEKRIYCWAKEIKSKTLKFTDYEAIAVILRANYIITGHTLTDVQILCSLIALRQGGNLKGKLLQVATGEGKSTIICILAIINALRGKKVDVITSSPVLAERDAKQKAKLYRMFDLTCSDNNDKTVYLKGKKDCYSSDIVYGEMSQFQFDILRDNYSKLGTLGDRKFTIAIVDEVDSMLIDDSSKIARLSSTVPGMDHFQALYVFIWQRLIAIRERFIMFNGKMYFVNGKIDFENGKITLEIADNNQDIMKIRDLETYLLTAKDISPVGELVEDIDEYLTKSLENYLDSQIKESKIYIPSNFTEFLKKQKPKWIRNAVEALNYQENVHYVVQGGEIKPVDYFSTGIVQSSTNWSDGLHQFLQLKHNLRMTSETLTTNFLSNIGFMKKYEQVYGMTGTLGSETARKVLKDVYRVDLINIPQRRAKQYLELESIVTQGEASWLKEITSSVKLEIQKERGVLVICETIEHANRISGMLKKNMRSSAVNSYTMNDMNQEKNVEKILPGEVIIATNLAGRGTDIQTDEIEATGGLHVILTFMPNNQRVEDQAFGRTARQGKRGTGIMILNANFLVGDTTTTKIMKMERDKIESGQLQEFKEKELKLIQVKDRLFDKFCSFLNDEIRAQIRKEQKAQMNLKQQVMNWWNEDSLTVYECSVLAAVEEQWAGFLSKLDEGTIKCDIAESECKALIDQLRQEFKDNHLIKNSYYNISIANDILINNPSKIKQALDYFEKAIRLEEQQKRKKKKQKPKVDAFGMEIESDKSGMTSEEESEKDKELEAAYGAGAAHMGAAWCLILSQPEGYKDKALSSFELALKCLSNEMGILNATQLLLEQKQPGFPNSDLYKQLNTKATILGSYLNGIQSCISAIKRSKRLIDVVAVKKHNKGDILETIKHFSEQERNGKNSTEFKNKDLKLKGEEKYSITFNHLITIENSGTIDQALVTLQKAFSIEAETDRSTLSSAKNKYFGQTQPLDKSYSDIRINLKQADLGTIYSSLFNPDKEFKDLTRESAIAKLKEERSYWHKFSFSESFETNLVISSNTDKNFKLVHKDKQINELINIVEDQEVGDDALRFDIVIKKANENEINKLFKSSERSAKLNVDFDNLNQQAATEKLSTIKARSFDIEFVLDRKNLLKLIGSDPTLKSCKWYDSEEKQFEIVTIKKFLKRINKQKTDETPCFVGFKELGLDQAKNIVKQCHESVSFAVSFVDVYDFYSSQLVDGQVNFSFDKLNQNTATLVIDELRKQHFDFSLEFKNLSDKEIRFVLKHADLEQENLEVKKVKNLSELFMKVSSPTSELNEYASKGIEYIIEINEKLFVPWRIVIAVAALGVGQIIAGGVLIATGFGANVGMGFITEGLADIFTAYRAYSSRQLLWSDYCKQKAVSLVLSAVSMGWSSLKNAGKGIETITTGVGQELLEQAGTQIINNKKVVGQVLVKTGANLKSLAAKYICVKTAEAVGRECINTGIKALADMSFDLLKPNISESVQWKVRSSFCNTELMGFLRKMHAIDLATNSHQLQSRVEQIVCDVVSPRSDFMRKQWDSVGLPLIKGVLSDSRMYGSTASMAFRIIATINGLYQVNTLIDNVSNTLVTKLRLVDKNSMTISLVFHRNLKIRKDNAKVIAKKFKELDIFDDCDNFQISQSDVSYDCEELKAKIDDFSDEWETNSEGVLKELDYENDSMEEDVQKCIEFVELFYEKYVNIDMDSFSTVMKLTSDQIADQLIRIMDSQLMQPWSTLAVSSLTDSISKRIQHYCLVDREQNSDSQNEDQKKYDELSKKEDLTSEEKAFMANYGKFRTFSEQINYNSRDYCAALSQCEMAYYASKEGPGKSSSEDVKKTANDVREGGPANLAVMMATAKKNGINLKVVDDKNYVKTQEDIDNGVEVVYFERGANNGVGHAYYMDNKGQFVEAKGTGNDCFFAAFSSILGNKGVSKSADDIRKETANQMESNSENFAKVLSAEKYIRNNHSDSSNNLLFTAGLYRDNTGRIKVEDEDIKDLIDSINGKKGRKRGGITGGFFKKTVPGDSNSETGKALHHIIPNSTIEALVLKDSNDPNFKSQLEDLINSEQIKPVTDKINIVPRANNSQAAPQSDKQDPKTYQLQPDNHGQFLHSALSWNPNNLVSGPLPDKRAQDPGDSIDKEILKAQPPSFQQAVKPFEENKEKFENIVKLPPAQPVNWEKRSSDNKYVVPDSSKNGGGNQ